LFEYHFISIEKNTLFHSAWSKLDSYIRKTHLIGSIQNTLYWDQNTYMPVKGSSWRGDQLIYLARKLHDRNTSDEFQELIYNAKEELYSGKIRKEDDIKNFSEFFRNIELLEKEFDRQNKIDPILVEKLAKARSNGYRSWVQAKESSNFKVFSSSLKELIALRKEESNQISSELSCWEVLAQPFEPDIRINWINSLFEPIKQEVPSLIENIKANFKTKVRSSSLDITESSQRRICKKLLEAFGIDQDIINMSDSPHPFSITLGPNDYRITTRFVKGQPFSSFLATAHEWGHSLYEQGLASSSNKWFSWPLIHATSMGVHESQALFWENRIAKNKFFLEKMYPYFKEEGLLFKNANDLWKSINFFSPGLNRVESDELTYGIHILIRTELEILLLEEDLDVNALPSEWNRRYFDLLGLSPKNDSEGCLQDVHWSEGAFGYFPSYLIGHIISAQITELMESEIGCLDNLLEKENFLDITDWLKQKVHHHGRALNSMDLIKKLTGNNMNAKYFLSYLNQKISSLS